jgi:hypothetical protein
MCRASPSWNESNNNRATSAVFEFRARVLPVELRSRAVAKHDPGLQRCDGPPLQDVSQAWHGSLTITDIRLAVSVTLSLPYTSPDRVLSAHEFHLSWTTSSSGLVGHDLASSSQTGLGSSPGTDRSTAPFLGKIKWQAAIVYFQPRLMPCFVAGVSISAAASKALG